MWAFLGDGETDEPESLGAISLAGREKLDNLIFVVNCNLQRLDGPVRGNGKIIQELETVFRGAGWNVIKVIWGSALGPAARGRPRRACSCARMDEAVDGEYQIYKARDGAYVREHFFGALPRAARDGRATGPTTRSGRSTAAATTREGLRRLRRGGRARPGQPDGDPRQDDQGLRDGRGRRGPEHHPPAEEDERGARCSPFRDRFGLPLTDEQVARGARSTSRADDSPEMQLPAASAARRSAAACRSAARDAPSRSRCPPLDGVRGPAQGHRRARDLDDDGVRPDPHHARARQADRHAHRADRARRVAHVRHGGDVPPARDLQPGRPALPARGRRAAHVLQGGQEGPDPPGGHQRGRRVLLLDRRGARRTPTTASR